MGLDQIANIAVILTNFLQITLLALKTFLKITSLLHVSHAEKTLSWSYIMLISTNALALIGGFCLSVN